MKVLIAVIAGLVAVNAQFIPQTKPICDRNGVIAGPSSFLPHETYCQLFYRCNEEHAFTQNCPDQTVFTRALPGCLPANNLQFAGRFCPNWQCTVGINYPDICCSRYWTCINNIFEQRSCPAGQVFEMSSGRCNQNNGQCIDNQFCELNRKVPTGNNKCTLGEVPGDKCKFTMFGAPGNMSCPAGTAFDKQVCACVHSQECTKGLGDFRANKEMDTQCSASYRTDFASGALNAFSDKMSHLFVNAFYTRAELNNLREIVMTPNTETELYSYYYVRNQLVAPMAMEIIFKADTNAQRFDLITNAAPVHLPQQQNQCTPTFSVAVTPSYNTMTFDIFAKSGDKENTEENLQIRANTQANTYIKFTLSFDNEVIKAQVFDVGIGNAQGRSVGSITGTVLLGTQLAYNECGFTIGHNMAGTLKKWAMYEGCTNPGTITQM